MECGRSHQWHVCHAQPVGEADCILPSLLSLPSPFQVFLQLNEQGLNVSLYWKNSDPRHFVNVVPTSAITGEGIPDLLQLMVKLTQTMMADRLMFVDDPQCTVLEVKTMEGGVWKVGEGTGKSSCMTPLLADDTTRMRFRALQSARISQPPQCASSPC